MFFYGENTGRPVGEWRPEIHDSDGLLVNDGATGEWLWRPLLNPRRLEVDYLQVESLGGFGLLQRDRHFDNYQDLGARYDQRPSAWVEPEGDWGPGKVVMVQLPTPAETNDNIVAFWTPRQPLAHNEPHRLAYTLTFGHPNVANSPAGQVINSFLGDGSIVGGGKVEGAYRVIVDFRGGPLDKLKPRAPVTGTVTGLEGSEILEHFVEYNAPLRSWRLSVLARPAADKPLALRAFLAEADRPLTETWTYRLPAGNDILPEGKRR
jgi:glucans biosynthesis protein